MTGTRGGVKRSILLGICRECRDLEEMSSAEKTKVKFLIRASVMRPLTEYRLDFEPSA